MSEWKSVKLDEFILFNPREILKKGTLAKKVAMDVLQPFCRDIPSYEFTEYNGGTKFRNGDTIMARITPCLENGKTAKVQILDPGEIGFGSTEYIVLRAIPNVSDENYVYYLTCSPVVREPAIKSMVGSSGRQRVQTDVIQNLEINVPDLETQKKIGGSLKSIDDKIELNNQINKNLEMQAQALFKAWFVDFEPFGGVMPDDWKETSLRTIANISTKSINPLKQPDLLLEHYSIPAFDEKHYPIFEYASEIKSNKYVITHNSVMISKLNPDTKRIWRPLCLSENPVCSTEFIVYEAINPNYKDYLYSIIDSQSFLDYLCSHTTGSTNSRQRATPKATLDYNCMLPSEETIISFCNIVTPMYEKIASSIIENQRLAELRDSLLPKLMNGEIDVSEVRI
ncbi:MAG: restriction endonuclease subunit S [Oscillospiraceae bacterium]|nr:restriction endonuclease subunit S [Oscillospiraceae bacterium]